MHIRPFKPADLPRLKEITVEAFDGVSIDQSIEKSFGLINERDWQFRKGRHVDDDAERAPEGIYVLDSGDEVAGLITTRMDIEAGIGFIPNLALATEFRGQGWGRKLIEYALQKFRDAGLTHARIETLTQNEIGCHLYQSIGFREVAKQIHFCMKITPAEDQNTDG